MALGNERSGSKTLLPLLISVPVLLGFAITAYYLWAEAAASRNQAMRDRVIWDARDVAALIQPTINHTRQLARLIEQARTAGAERDIIKGLAVPTLDLRREFLGVAVVFEPNGFDGRDVDYEGKLPENDGNGRFSAYYYRETGKPAATAVLEMAELSNTEGWYGIPLKTGRPALSLPYLYPVDGIERSISSVSVPIQDAGKSVGVTTIDFFMTEIEKKVLALKSTEIIGAWIVSADGLWVVHQDKTKVGSQLTLGVAGPEGEIEMFRRRGGTARTGTPQTHEAENGVNYLMTPIALDGVDQSWFLVVAQQPVSLLEGTPKDTTKMATILGVTLLVGIMALAQVWLTSRGGKSPTSKSAPRPVSATATAPSNLKAKSRPPLSRREPTVRRR